MAVIDGVYRQSKKVRQLYHYPPKIQQRAVEFGITTAYHSAYKNGMKHMERYDKGQCRKIKKEYKQIVLRAKDIGKSRLLNAYFMGAYFIARNRGTECPAEENYQFFQMGLYKYHTCGICRLCQDEGCPELAKYLCRLDFVMTDRMGMKLVWT